MTTSYRLEPCPVCAATDAQLIAHADELARERAWLRALRPRRTPAASHDTIDFTQPPPLALVRCHRCTLLYRNPAELHVEQTYEEEATPIDSLATLHDVQQPAFAPLVRRLASHTGRIGNALEVGSYAGAFIAAAAAAGWQVDGVDVNPRVVDFLNGKGYRVQLGGIEDAPADRRYDAVLFWNCFDQLADPAAALAAARIRVSDGGVLALRVPNGDFYLALRPLLAGPLAMPARALLARHNFLGFPYRCGFTRASLARLLDAHGFRVAAMHGAGVLPAGGEDRPRARDRLLDAAARVLRPRAGAPWLEIFAIPR